MDEKEKMPSLQGLISTGCQKSEQTKILWQVGMPGGKHYRQPKKMVR